MPKRGLYDDATPHVERVSERGEFSGHQAGARRKKKAWNPVVNEELEGIEEIYDEEWNPRTVGKTLDENYRVKADEEEPLFGTKKWRVKPRQIEDYMPTVRPDEPLAFYSYENVLNDTPTPANVWWSLPIRTPPHFFVPHLETGEGKPNQFDVKLQPKESTLHQGFLKNLRHHVCVKQGGFTSCLRVTTPEIAGKRKTQYVSDILARGLDPRAPKQALLVSVIGPRESLFEYLIPGLLALGCFMVAFISLDNYFSFHTTAKASKESLLHA